MTGKSVGAADRAIALELSGGGVCWTRQVEILFTKTVSDRTEFVSKDELTDDDAVA